MTDLYYVEDAYRLYNELDESLNTPWDIYYDFTAARFQSEKLYLNFGDEHYRFIAG